VLGLAAADAGRRAGPPVRYISASVHQEELMTPSASPGRARSPLDPFAFLVLAVLAAPAPARAAAPAGPPFQVVSPGGSIQAAIDRAPPGGWVVVLPGVYHETADATNGLVIGKPLSLVGLSTPQAPVVLEATGDDENRQKNGIVAVDVKHAACMDCHTSLAPPFPRIPGKMDTPLAGPSITGLAISGITIKDFANNGLFLRGVDDFSIVDVHAVDNPNYGIFPVSSSHGIITRSSARGSNDTGIWVETSDDVRVTDNLVEDNVNGFEISNSQDILVAGNEVRGNTVGIASFFLPDIFHVRPYARRYTIRDNHVHDNNRQNTAEPDAILSTVPPGVGILHIGVDDSTISGNRVENNQFLGIAVADYCLVAQGPFACGEDPDTTAEFIALNGAVDNVVKGNVVRNNGTVPTDTPFDFARSDLGLLTDGDHGNCFQGNAYGTAFSLIGFLPACH
jgi:parallel beta-helix repeat protein